MRLQCMFGLYRGPLVPLGVITLRIRCLDIGGLIFPPPDVRFYGTSRTLEAILGN